MYKINNNKAICTPKYLTKVHIISKKKREREREREREGDKGKKTGRD